MFLDDKKVKSASVRPLKELTEVVPIAEILKDAKRQHLIERIKSLSALEDSRFESLCFLLIENLIRHCQSLPDSSNSYYTHACGFIDYALNRTEAALTLFREYILQEHDTEEISEIQKLWIYTLLSAGLLQGIGKLQMDFNLDLYDINGHFLKTWSPLIENLSSVGHYYYYEFEKEGDVEFGRRLNVLLARLLMPNSGFAWIASHQEVLKVWLALLHEDIRSAGTLACILIRADAIAIQRYFDEHLIKGFGGRGNKGIRIGTFVDPQQEPLIEKERLVGMEFIKWLTEKLANGTIMINKAPLLAVPGGLLMNPEIFKLFILGSPEYKNWQADQVKKGFLALGLHQTNAQGEVLSRFERADGKSIESGILFKDYAIALPAQMKVVQLNNDKVKELTATEVIYASQFNHHYFNQEQANMLQGLKQLSAAGIWEQKPENSVRNNKGV